MSKINDLTEGGNSLYTGSVTYSYDTHTKILDLLQHQQIKHVPSRHVYFCHYLFLYTELLEQKIRPMQYFKVQLIVGREGIEVQFYSFFNRSTRWVWVVNTMPWPLYR